MSYPLTFRKNSNFKGGIPIQIAIKSLSIKHFRTLFPYKWGIPLQDFPATYRKYCNFKTIFYQVVMGYPIKLLYFRQVAGKQGGFPVQLQLTL